MNNKDDFLACYLVGGFVSIAISFMIWHAIESNCQNDNNVADCEWISVPVQIEAKVTSE